MGEETDKHLQALTSEVNRLSRRFDDYVVGGGPKSKGSQRAAGADDVDDFTTDFSKDENDDRGNWSGQLDFILACLGYAVGLGNVWRFPYLCYKNGGAVFFIPYVIMLFLVGMPIFFLELSLGQFTSNGPLTCWEMAPIFKGIGVGMMLVSAFVGIYYNMIIAWSLHYLFNSFTANLPWQYCDNWWNSPFCADLLTDTSMSNCIQLGFNASIDGVCYNGTTPYGIYNATIAKDNGLSKMLPSAEYLDGFVLGKTYSTGIDDLGPINWRLVLSLLGAWSIVCLSLIKGIKSSGKVVYFTALFPYWFLLILLIRGVTLPGYYEGIRFYILNVKFEKLKDATVWKDAAVQIFFSLSSGFGGLHALSSYNRFHNNVFRDTLIITLGNCLTSLFAGFVIFSFLGYLAHSTGQDVEEVVAGGVGLAFVVYPAAIINLPVAPLWAIGFFLMLITLGLDSEFAMVETVTTCIHDQFPQTRERKSLVIIGVSVVLFILGLTMCTNGGALMLQLFDHYSGGWNLLFLALMECICICYVYGFRRFIEDIKCMLGTNGVFPLTAPWWIITWGFFTPIGIVFILIFSWISYEPVTYGSYSYPVWADALGWMMTMAVVLSVFVVGLIMMCVAPGNFSQKMKWLVTPTKYWGPALPKHRRLMTRYIPAEDFDINPWVNKGGKHNGEIAMDNLKGGRDNQAYE